MLACIRNVLAEKLLVYGRGPGGKWGAGGWVVRHELDRVAGSSGGVHTGGMLGGTTGVVHCVAFWSPCPADTWLTVRVGTTA